MASQRVEIADSSQVSEARRAAEAQAVALGLNQTERGRLAVVTTELATNVLRHGGGGAMLIDSRDRGVHVLALDKGPGIKNLAECMRDGYSTGGSAGQGLGAVTRMADVFDIYGAPGHGAAAYAQVRAGAAPKQNAFTAGGVSVPVKGETQCGDAWAFWHRDGEAALIVADGLGHGPFAATAARAAISLWQTEAARSAPAELLTRAHGALRATRGAAVSCLRVQRAAHTLTYAGVGNVAGTIVSAELKMRSMVSNNGTVGMEVRRIQEFQYPLEAGATVILCSDGITTHWRLDQYPGLLQRHPAIIAGVIYRDHNRGRDDATVAVLKI